MSGAGFSLIHFKSSHFSPFVTSEPALWLGGGATRRLLHEFKRIVQISWSSVTTRGQGRMIKERGAIAPLTRLLD